MKYHQPYGVSDPNAPYVNGNPSTGTMGSIPPAASIEYPQREIVSLITHAGLAPPDDADLSQLAKSVQSMLMNSQDDAGTANAYQVTMHPAPSAYYKYLMVILKVGNDNTGPSVLNVNALGPKPIVHIDGTALDAGNMRAGAIVCLMFDGVNFQMVWSSGGVAGIPGAPIFLTAPRNLYVNFTTGDDAAYDGTTAAAVAGTIHGPFKTCQRATYEVNKYNLNNFNVNVWVADGTYPPFALPSPSGNGMVSWTGNSTTPRNCVINGVGKTAIGANNCGLQQITGFKVQASGDQLAAQDPLCGIYVSGGASNVGIAHIEWGTTVGTQCVSARAATVTLWGNHIITGNAMGGPAFNGGHLDAFFAGIFQVNSDYLPTLSIPNPVSLSYFLLSVQGANIALLYQSITGAGNVTGKKFDASLNGVISTWGSNVNYFPGNIAGTTASGGQYA